MKTQFFSSLPQLHVACGKDPLRPAFTYVQIKKFEEGKQGPAGWYAAATDAHVLVWIRLSDYMDTNFFDQLNETELHLPAKDWKLLCKAEFIDIASDGLTLELFDKKFCNIGYIRFLAQDKMERFPTWDVVIPEIGLIGVEFIAFSPTLLNRLTTILDRGTLKFEFRAQKAAATVGYISPSEHNHDRALLFPVFIMND